MPYGKPYRILLDGDRDVAARYIPAGQAWALKLELVSPGQTVDKTYRLTEAVRMRIRITPELDGRIDRAIFIHAEPPCEEFVGGFLTEHHDNNRRYIHYTDGVVSEVGNDQQKGDQARANDVVLDPQSYASMNRRYPHYYTGRIRIAVQCQHLMGTFVALRHDFQCTHGVFDPNPTPEPFDLEDIDDIPPEDYEERQVFLIEIGVDGVFAFPVEWDGRCCSMLDYTDLLPTDEELEDDPGLQTFRTNLSLAWAFHHATEDSGRDKVQRLIAAGDVNDIFGTYLGWYTGQAWAFSYSGRVAQNVCQHNIGAPAAYRTCRWGFTFGYDVNTRIVSASKQQTEAEQLVTFWRTPSVGISVLWTPDLTARGYYDAILPFSTAIASDGPIHCWYDGEDLQQLRWTTSTAAGFSDNNLGGVHIITTMPGATARRCPLSSLPGDIHEVTINDTHNHTNGARTPHGFYIAGGYSGIAPTNNTSDTLHDRTGRTVEYNNAPSTTYNNTNFLGGCGGAGPYNGTLETWGVVLEVQNSVSSQSVGGRSAAALTPDREGCALFEVTGTSASTSTAYSAEFSLGGTPYYSWLAPSDGVASEPPVILEWFTKVLGGSLGGGIPPPLYNQPADTPDVASRSLAIAAGLVGRAGGTVYGYGDSSGGDMQDLDEFDGNIYPFLTYTPSRVRVFSGLELVQGGLQEQGNRFAIFSSGQESLITGYTPRGSSRRSLCFVGRQ